MPLRARVPFCARGPCLLLLLLLAVGLLTVGAARQRRYPFAHPSRSSYELAVLNPLIRIPALIPGGDGDGGDDDDDDDDSCCLFFNFRHFKVHLKDSHSWRAANSEQRRLLAELAAVQL